MGLLDKILGRRPIAVDRDRGDAFARELRTQAERGDLVALHRGFESLRDWDDVAFHVTTLADQQGRPPWLDEFVAVHPASSLAHTLRGAHSIHWAWQARGAGRAATVDEGAWAAFRERLEAAVRDLERAAELAQYDPTPWALMIRAAMGLEWDVGERQHLFAQAVQRHPRSYVAHDRLLTALTAKWGGSHEAMFELARSSAGAPLGSMLHAMVARAHIERWLHHGMQGERDLQAAYFTLPDVRNEVVASFRRSVDAPLTTPSKNIFEARHIYAFCFFLMDEQDLLRREIERLGFAITEFPWAFIDEPPRAFQKARRAAGYF